MADNFLDGSSMEASLETQGYESFYEEGKSDGMTSVWDSTDYSPPVGYTPTGKEMSYQVETSLSGDKFKNYVYGKDNRVFGLPFKYSQLADPLNRVFQSTFESDTSTIAFIKFGVPKINKLLYQKMTADQNNENGSAFGIGSNIMLGLTSLADPNSRVQDQRLISFEEANSTFMKYASASISQIMLLLDLPAGLNVDDTWSDSYGKDGFAFYCVKTSAINESVENDYTTPDIIQQMNGDAAQKRQNYQLYGTYNEVKTNGTATAWLSNIATGMLEKVKENIANMPIIGSVASVFMSTNKGSMSYYGEIWADSKNVTDFQLQFKFRTPYGNKFDIMRNIYIPFLMLHTAAIPKQDGRFSYQEPFMVQIDFPGWFRVNCGVIKSLSWTKGGDNALFNTDGLPLEMNVTMNVTDLYPIQLASENLTKLAYNYGLLSFLESMAGLTVSQANALDVTGFDGILAKNLKNSNGSVGGNIGAIFKSGLTSLSENTLSYTSLTRAGTDTTLSDDIRNRLGISQSSDASLLGGVAARATNGLIGNSSLNDPNSTFVGKVSSLVNKF